VVPASAVGRPCKYAYIAHMQSEDDGVPRFLGVAKIDLTAPGPAEGALAGLVLHGDSKVGGEASFVPRKGGKEEDDGYLVTFVYDEKEGQSELVGYDAKTMANEVRFFLIFF
jgi:carotenoid cleavage dioxygenase-like enzyme